MNLDTLLDNVLRWLATFVFWPLRLLGYLGDQLASCDSELTEFSLTLQHNILDWLQFFHPVLRYLPWPFIWSFLWAVILWQLFMLLLRLLPTILEFVGRYWLVIAVLWVCGGIVTSFIGEDWKNSTVFTSVFGESPTTTTGYAEGGGGGGGGGSW